jgi:hypothetical protein
MRCINHRCQAAGICRKTPAVVTGELVFAVGHQGALVQWQAACREVTHKMHQVLKRVALNVELAVWPVFHHGGDFIHVVAPDVTLIWPGVHGDALRARFKTQTGRTDHIGDTQVAGVAQQRDLVDIHRQCGFAWVLWIGVTGSIGHGV